MCSVGRSPQGLKQSNRNGWAGSGGVGRRRFLVTGCEWQLGGLIGIGRRVCLWGFRQGGKRIGPHQFCGGVWGILSVPDCLF